MMGSGGLSHAVTASVQVSDVAIESEEALSEKRMIVAALQQVVIDAQGTGALEGFPSAKEAHRKKGQIRLEAIRFALDDTEALWGCKWMCHQIGLSYEAFRRGFETGAYVHWTMEQLGKGCRKRAHFTNRGGFCKRIIEAAV